MTCTGTAWEAQGEGEEVEGCRGFMAMCSLTWSEP